MSAIICAITGIVLATANVSVTNSWQAWVVIVLVALNNVIGKMQK